MASYLPNNSYGAYGGYGGSTHQYAYNLQDHTVQQLPSGVFFQSSQIGADGEEFEVLEKGIDPLNIFPTFYNLDSGFVSNTTDGAPTPSTSSEARCLPLLDVNIDVDVQFTIAKTKVTQTFTNLSSYVIRETNYSFPLYDGSAVISFRCHVGEDKLLEGAIKPKEIAKQEFREAVAKQKVAALLEEHTPEVFETKLGNIPARSFVKVEITYVNELKADIGGEGVLVTLPTSMAPRYGAPPPQMLPSSTTDKNGLHITVHVHASVSLRKLESRTHPISVEMGAAGTIGKPAAVSSFGDLVRGADKSDNEFDPKKAKATLSERNVTLGRDFVLLILASGSSMVASGAQLEEASGAELQSAMKLTLNPRDIFSSYVEPESFNGEIIFIADRSGSMHGLTMDTLKDALDVFLKSLTEGVRFNIYSFGSSFTSLWPQSQPYTDDNVEAAVQHVSTFRANMGGTEILRPIKDAVQKRIVMENFTTQIICLTDGEVWSEAEVREFVSGTRLELKDAVRFFALGIGNKVSHRLVEGIGTEGGGFAEVIVVDGRGRLEGRVMRMLKGALTPASYDCELEFDGRSTYAASSSNEGSSFMQAPYKILPLHPFSRTTIYFLFDNKYSADLKVVTLKSSTPSGEHISVKIPVVKAAANTYIVHHLAAKAIVMDLETGKSWLHSTLTNSKVADAAAKDLGERLAVNYHITSKWTSFVAREKKGNEENTGRLYKAPRRDLAELNKRRTAPTAQFLQAHRQAVLATTGPWYTGSPPLKSYVPPYVSSGSTAGASRRTALSHTSDLVNSPEAPSPKLGEQFPEPYAGSDSVRHAFQDEDGSRSVSSLSVSNKSGEIEQCFSMFSKTSKIKEKNSVGALNMGGNSLSSADFSSFPSLTMYDSHTLVSGESPVPHDDQRQQLRRPQQQLERSFDLPVQVQYGSCRAGSVEALKSELDVEEDDLSSYTQLSYTIKPMSKSMASANSSPDSNDASMALNLRNVIRMQSAQGSFRLPPSLLTAICSHFTAGIMSMLEATLASYSNSNGEDMKTKLGDTLEFLLQTMLVVTWIKLACAPDKEIWELLVWKAERWIGKMVGEVNTWSGKVVGVREVQRRLGDYVREQWIDSHVA
ncbi:uncharacterized protein BDR25DRAFT_297284 [Lindgomyces ingoldianus]|uniref:Uncharacterized protein n=1 Tax=Lindgomyces ingoldianus TaxID=673940 RepID=A0ACB6QAM2_9PLEO|nr:uncharacterized protein BDR25DRAFT_297284 [Lindgomyces ingoldianus]KAF2463983.1 hypothetical protein BDR25DRAFT_297284 [Lindgomyces ingoldianus]